MTAPLPEIYVTETDLDRLSSIIDGLADDHVVGRQLDAELERAHIVESEEIPPDVVTMNSRVEIEDVDTGERHVVQLVYPAAANFEAGRLSILAPVGAALLGLREGQSIEWPVRGGGTKSMRVVAVEWQPEAAGELDL